MFEENLYLIFSGVWFGIMTLILWEVVWKALAMWKSARNNHLAWYICILIFNTAGILPIIYLIIYRNKNKKVVKKEIEVKKETKEKPVKKATKKKVTKKK